MTTHGSRPFEKFESQRKELLRARSTNRSSETIATLERQVEKQFLADYNGLKAWFVERGKPVVLFFDTFEVVQDRGQIGFWLLRQLIPIIQNTVVAFAGRRPLPELPEDIAVTVLPIGNFDLAETQLYLHSRDVFLSDVSKFQHIYELTRGSPLLLALVVEWYLVHQDMVELVGDRDDLDSQTQDWFERQLISSVLCLDHPDAYEAVWYMAHVFHRFDAEILALSAVSEKLRTARQGVAATVRTLGQVFLEKAMKRKGFWQTCEELSEEDALVRELLAERTRTGLTQEAVAVLTGTTKSAVSRLETVGKHAPSMTTLKKYAQAVCCHLEIKLLPDTRPNKRSSRTAHKRASG